MVLTGLDFLKEFMKKLLSSALILLSLTAEAYTPKQANTDQLRDMQMNNFRIVPSASSKQFGGKGAYSSASTSPAFCFGSDTAGTDSTIRAGYQGQKSTVGTTPANSQVRGVSYNSTSNTLFAFGTVSPGSTGFVLYGTDCVTWSTGTWSGSGYGRAGASSPTMNVIVGGSNVGADCNISYSVAGATWTAATITGSACVGAGELFNVIWNGTKFVATGFSKYATSTDGITWTVGNLPTGSWKGLTWNGSKFAIVKGTSDSQFATSTDGVTWTTLGQVHDIGGCSSTSFIWNGKFYFCSTLNKAGVNAAYSEDLINWKTVALPAGYIVGAASDGVRIIGVNSAPVTATDTFVLSMGSF